MKLPSRSHGVTLVELVVAIAVIGAAVAGVLSVMNLTASRSADPMIQQQAQLIAESYLEEVLLKAFYDPNTNNVCPAPEASRASYDNVCDYNGLNDSTGARNQFGTLLTGLESYNVTVTVTADGTVTLDTINNTGAIRVLQVNITVTHDNRPGISVQLTGYRTNYNCNLPADSGCKPL